MNRRSFLSSCLALAAAPAIVRADSLMRIVPRDAGLLIADDMGVVLPIDLITRGALRLAHEKAAFISAINRSYEFNYCEVGSRIVTRRQAPFSLNAHD